MHDDHRVHRAKERTRETTANVGQAREDSPATRSLVVHDDHRVPGVVQQDEVHILATKTQRALLTQGQWTTQRHVGLDPHRGQSRRPLHCGTVTLRLLGERSSSPRQRMTPGQLAQTRSGAPKPLGLLREPHRRSPLRGRGGGREVADRRRRAAAKNNQVEDDDRGNQPGCTQTTSPVA